MSFSMRVITSDAHSGLPKVCSILARRSIWCSSTLPSLALIIRQWPSDHCLLHKWICNLILAFTMSRLSTHHATHIFKMSNPLIFWYVNIFRRENRGGGKRENFLSCFPSSSFSQHVDWTLRVTPSSSESNSLPSSHPAHPVRQSNLCSMNQYNNGCSCLAYGG